MADDIPKIPKATSLFINSGNIVNWNRLKRKPTQKPTAELIDCISVTLKTFLDETDATKLQYVTNLECVHQEFNQTIPEGERQDLKLTVKIFLCSLIDPQCVEDAINYALKALGTKHIETALIAFPEVDGSDISYEQIIPYWKVLEKLVDDKVFSIGVADLDKCTLEKLYDNVDVKPVINQVNLESCCVMPKDLVEYAKEKDIILLTHNDPRDLIPVDLFQDVISEVSTEKDREGWEPQWVLRYSTLLKCQGIIKSKGYHVKAVRDKKRK